MIIAKDSHGNYVKIEDIKQQDSFKGISPIDFKSNGDNLKNYRIYGNTVNGESVGDRTGNLVDKTKFVYGYRLSNIGTLYTTPSEQNLFAVSEFIEVNSGEQYIISQRDATRGYARRISFYQSKNENSWLSNNDDSDLIFTVPNTATYLRFTTLQNYIDSIMLIRGTSLPTQYEPYGYKIPVVVNGKNLLQNNATSQTVNGVTFTVNNDKSITCNGTATGTAAITINTIFSINSTKISGCPMGGSWSSFELDLLNINTNNVDVIDTGNGAVIQNENSYRVRIRIASGYTCNNLTFYPMIRKTDITDDTYEPYHAPVTTPIYLPEQIRKVGDEAEYIDFGEQKQHRVRKNLLQNTGTSRTINGVTFTVNSDGSVTCNGTANDVTWFDINRSFDTYAPDGRIVSIGNQGSLNTFYLNVGYVGNVISSHKYTDTTHNNAFVHIVIAADYTCDNLTFYPMIRKADIEDDTYEPYIENTELDVTIPALPTLSGTNTLSVNTNIKPSKVWGGLNDPRDILYVKDKLGNILFSKYYEIEDDPPLTYKAKKAGTLKDYRIYGNTVDGESVGDRTGNLFDGSWENKFIDTYGNIGYSTDRVLSSYVTVIPNQTYSVKSNMRIRAVHSYNDTTHTQALIDNAAGLDGATFTIPADSNSIRISLKKANDGVLTPDDVEWCMLNIGSETLPYEPYGYKVPMIIKGINLFDESVVVDKEVNTEYSNFQVYHQGGILYLNGTTTSTQADIEIAKMSSINSEMLEYINQNYGKYVFTSISPGTIQIRFLNSDSENYAYTSNSYTSTSSRSANRFVFRMQKDYQYDHEPIGILIKKEQIQSVYEPYHAPTTTTLYLPEQIKKVGDEAEYIDFMEQKQHRVRKNQVVSNVTSGTIDNGDGTFFYITANHDGSVTCNGYAKSTIFISNSYIAELEASTRYILSGCPQGGEYMSYCLDLRLPTGQAIVDYGIGQTFSVDTPGIYVPTVRIAADYTCDNLTFYPMIRKADIEDDTYEPYIENTELDVTLPALPTLSGTNTLSVETEIQPSDIYLKGKIEKKPKIYYYSQDGQTLLYTESVLKGSNGIYSGTPTKMADPQYTYTFAGWSSSTGQTAATPEVRNNIQNDKNVYAAFSQTLNTYTVYFYNESDTPIETVQNVPYGGTATYTGATPTKQGYSFTGWSPLPTNITADTSCYAQYESITDTWSQIIANVSNGTYSTKYHIGDTKKIDLGTEGEVIMTIVGIDTDDLADNSGKAPITWISKQLLKTSHRMNPAKQRGTSGTGTLGGWGACEMRSYLINTIKPLMPSEVRNALKTVKKYTKIYDVSETVVNDVLTTDDVWIPSYKEVFGTGRETQGPTYSTVFPDKASRIKSKAGSSAAWWWLRSAYSNYTFDLVYTDGSYNRNYAYGTGGVALGFCT